LIALEKIAPDLGSSVSHRIYIPNGVSTPHPRMLMSSFVAFKVAIELLPDKETEMLPQAYSMMKPGTPDNKPFQISLY
jgi:hypothetical protein